MSFHSVEREFEVRDLALARLEGEKERGGEVQVRYSGSGNILIRIESESLTFSGEAARKAESS